MAVSVKTYLNFDSGNPEIRRFSVPQDVSSSYLYLVEKIQRVYPNLLRKKFELLWQDQDGELITFSSDEELMEALAVLKADSMKVFIKEEPEKTEPPPASDGVGLEEHVGVVCDVCDGGIKGTRYKCLVCVDYDLCGNCEKKGFHSEHEMIRICKPRRGPFRDWWQTWGRCGNARRGKCRQHRGCPWRPHGGRHQRPPFTPGAFPTPPPPPPPSHFGPHGPFGAGPWNGSGGPWNCGPKTGEKSQGGDNQNTNIPEYFKVLGEFLGGVLQPFGIDVETYADTPGGCGNNTDCTNCDESCASACGEKSGKGEDVEKSDPPDEVFAGEVSTQQTEESDTQQANEQTTSTSDPDFVMVEDKEDTASPENTESTEKESPSAEEDQFQTRLNEAVAQMEAMGFRNDDGWLTQLLVAKDCDVGRVINTILPQGRFT